MNQNHSYDQRENVNTAYKNGPRIWDSTNFVFSSFVIAHFLKVFCKRFPLKKNEVQILYNFYCV